MVEIKKKPKIIKNKNKKDKEAVVEAVLLDKLKELPYKNSGSKSYKYWRWTSKKKEEEEAQRASHIIYKIDKKFKI